MIKVVFFDLDGTLLPMDLGVFIKAYVGSMAKHLAKDGYDFDRLIKAFMAGMTAMLENDGTRTNEAAFWESMDSTYGGSVSSATESFERYYAEEFDKVSATCGYTPEAKETLELLHSMNVPCVLATSPVYPVIATHKRMAWAGVSPSDFIAVTTFEDSRFAKPNPKYFSELASSLGYLPEECLVVGNDTRDDLSAVTVGMKIFFLTNDLINRDNIDISEYPHGDFAALKEYLISIFK
ncbi:MAG: HAD family hydrolase [Clostridia bacterium]|nr:HAD family hydrolase [Clostridia bacterium]